MKIINQEIEKMSITTQEKKEYQILLEDNWSLVKDIEEAKENIIKAEKEDEDFYKKNGYVNNGLSGKVCFYRNELRERKHFFKKNIAKLLDLEKRIGCIYT